MGFSVKRDFIPLVITIDNEIDLRVFKRILNSAKVNETRYITPVAWGEKLSNSDEVKMIDMMLEKIN